LAVGTAKADPQVKANVIKELFIVFFFGIPFGFMVFYPMFS
jgi:hypothetical protein